MKTSLRSVLFFTLLTLIVFNANAFQDTTIISAPQKKSSIKFTTRVHSMGLFSYGGRIACDNPSFDANFIYQRKRWGYFLFKAMDLYDHHSDNNFALTTFFTNIRLGKIFTVTPHVGLFIEQLHSVADHGSDAGVIIITTAKLSDHLKVDYTSMMSSLVFEPENRDWTNRIRVTYQAEHLDITYFSWHNNGVFDACGHLSTGLNVSYAKIKVSDHVSLSTGLTGILMLRTTDPEGAPKKNGIVFTIAAAVE